MESGSVKCTAQEQCTDTGELVASVGLTGEVGVSTEAVCRQWIPQWGCGRGTLWVLGIRKKQDWAGGKVQWSSALLWDMLSSLLPCCLGLAPEELFIWAVQNNPRRILLSGVSNPGLKNTFKKHMLINNRFPLHLPKIDPAEREETRISLFSLSLFLD